MHVTLPVPLGPGTYMVDASCCPWALEIGRQVTFLQSLQDGVAGGGGAAACPPYAGLCTFSAVLWVLWGEGSSEILAASRKWDEAPITLHLSLEWPQWSPCLIQDLVVLGVHATVSVWPLDGAVLLPCRARGADRRQGLCDLCPQPANWTQ